MRLYTVLLYFCRQLYMFRMIPHPSSGARVNCNYSIWHWSIRICYLPLTWRSRNSVPTRWDYIQFYYTSADSCTCSDSSTSAEDSKYGSTNARCCNYSLRVLLMMDEGIIRNMYSCLQKYNKSVYSLMLLDNYWHWLTMHGPMNIKEWRINTRSNRCNVWESNGNTRNMIAPNAHARRWATAQLHANQ